ncbi:MAG: PAS domain-containing protein [Alphaproteobacteria bacterium]|nr:PAS domain-containing protein [Alphaproteobacteria bacterium]
MNVSPARGWRALLSRRGAITLLMIAGVVAIGAALVFGGLQAQKRRAETQELYAHTLEVMAAARELMSSLQDLETGQRGYLLSHDPDYLEPYVRADRKIDGQIDTLKLLSRDPRQQTMIDTLTRQIAGQRLSLGQSIVLAKSGRFDQAVDLYKSDAGRRWMDDIRDTMNSILSLEERAQVERRTASQNSAQMLGLYLLGLLIVGLALIAFAVSSAFIALSASAKADLESERAATATRIAEGERRFRTITEAIPQIVWSSDANGRFGFVNARWREFTGSPGTAQAWVDHIHPDDRPGVSEAWRRSIETGETYEREVRLRDANGAYRWFLCRAVPLRNASGQIEQWLGAGTDIHEARLNLEAREILSQELSHRIKNIFSVVGSLIALSARDDPAQTAFANGLRNRVSALARAHEFVRPHSPESALRGGTRTFSGFIADLLAAYSEDDSGRIRFTGEDFSFGDKCATPLALFFHELGTNAAKYGALSRPGGHVEIDSSREGADWRVTWSEHGGPEISAPPSREGFGTKLAQLSVEGQLGGSIAKSWTPEGLRVDIRLPADVMER